MVNWTGDDFLFDLRCLHGEDHRVGYCIWMFSVVLIYLLYEPVFIVIAYLYQNFLGKKSSEVKVKGF